MGKADALYNDASLKKEDLIELTFPLKPEYVSLVRLAVSGVASRAGFDIEDIEDIKVSVSEVCNRIIGVSEEGATDRRGRIAFAISGERLEIFFYRTFPGQKIVPGGDEESLAGFALMSALMDEVKLYEDGEGNGDWDGDGDGDADILVSMAKILKENNAESTESDIL